MTILVTGGTGTLGRRLVPRLLGAGTRVRVLSRRPDQAGTDGPGPAWFIGDLDTGAGIARAVDGVATIVHCASGSQAKGTDVPGTSHLLGAAKAAGGAHVVYISIVGIDQIPMRYYRDKLATERLIADSGLPWTTLRTTQFHELAAYLVRRLARLPVVPVPAGTSLQPIDSGEVADRLVQLAAGPAQGRVEDMGGPAVHTFAELVGIQLRVSGAWRRPVLPVWLPGATARAFRRGAHLTPDHAVGCRTFSEHLRARS